MIDAVCRAADHGTDNRATAIAAVQGVTAGTLTTAVNLLERKGYVERQRDEKDRRAVRILPTPLARKAESATGNSTERWWNRYWMGYPRRNPMPWSMPWASWPAFSHRQMVKAAMKHRGK